MDLPFPAGGFRVIIVVISENLMDHATPPPKVVISTGTIIRFIVVLLFFAFLYFMRDLLLVIMTAIVIASAIEPIVKFLGRAKLRRLPAVILTYAGLALLVAGLFYFFLPLLLDDLASFLEAVPRYVDSVSLWDPTGSVGAAPRQFVEKLSQGVESSRSFVEGLSDGVPFLPPAADSGSAAPSLQEFVARFQSAFSSGFLQVVSVIFGGILSVILIIVLAFYLSVQENGINAFLRIVTPLRHERYVTDLWRRSQEKIGRWMQGQLLLGVLVAVLVFLGLSILGIRNALLFAVIAAVFEIIPVFGPILSSIPPIVTGFSQGGLTLALLVTGLFIIIQQFENHLIYPLVVRKIVGVPPIIIIIALVVGGKLAGFLGILLAVPVAAVLVEYLNDLERRKITAETGGV